MPTACTALTRGAHLASRAQLGQPCTRTQLPPRDTIRSTHSALRCEIRTSSAQRSELRARSKWQGGRLAAGSCRVVPRASAADSSEVDAEGCDVEVPKGCVRYTIKLRRPLGLVLEETKQGTIVVAEIVEGGAAEATGMVSVGDELIATSAMVFTNTQSYNDVAVKSGEQDVRLCTRGEKFETVMAAIGSNRPGGKVTLEFQQCDKP